MVGQEKQSDSALHVSHPPAGWPGLLSGQGGGARGSSSILVLCRLLFIMATNISWAISKGRVRMGRCYSVPEPRDEYREGLRFGTIIVSVCHTGRLLRAPGRGLTQVIREASLRRHPRRFWKAKSEFASGEGTWEFFHARE